MMSPGPLKGETSPSQQTEHALSTCLPGQAAILKVAAHPHGGKAAVAPQANAYVSTTAVHLPPLPAESAGNKRDPVGKEAQGRGHHATDTGLQGGWPWGHVCFN